MIEYFDKNKILFRLVLVGLFVIVGTGVWLCWVNQSSGSESVSETQNPTPLKSETPSSSIDPSTSEAEVEEGVKEPPPTEESDQGDMDEGYQAADTVQKIFFMSGWTPPRDLVMSNPDGSFITYLAKATGSLDVSQDGTLLAIGCENPEQICIYDITKIPNYMIFPFDVDYDFFYPERLDVGKACSTEKLAEFGIPSLSWSNDGSKLTYICEGKQPDGKLFCVYSFDSNITDCQDGEITGYGEIRFVSYSPKEDILLVSVGEPPYYPQPKLLVINEDKEVIRVLGLGDEGAWSPDGEQIAYAKNPDRNGDVSWGYYIINKDGSGADAIFSNDRQMIPLAEFFQYCRDISVYCGMSWSSNGNQLFFGATVSTSGYFYQIFRYDFEEDEILNLTWRNYTERQDYTMPVFAEIPK